MLEWMAVVRRVWSQSESLLRFLMCSYHCIYFPIVSHCYILYSPVFCLSFLSSPMRAGQEKSILYSRHSSILFLELHSLNRWGKSDRLWWCCDGVIPSVPWQDRAEQIQQEVFVLQEELQVENRSIWTMEHEEHEEHELTWRKCCRCCRCCRCCLSRPFVALFIYSIYSLLMRTGSQRTVGVGGCAGAWNILEFGLWQIVEHGEHGTFLFVWIYNLHIGHQLHKKIWGSTVS